jgi:hypothetical protein
MGTSSSGPNTCQFEKSIMVCAWWSQVNARTSGSSAGSCARARLSVSLLAMCAWEAWLLRIRWCVCSVSMVRKPQWNNTNQKKSKRGARSGWLILQRLASEEPKKVWDKSRKSREIIEHAQWGSMSAQYNKVEQSHSTRYDTEGSSGMQLQWNRSNNQGGRTCW